MKDIIAMLLADEIYINSIDDEMTSRICEFMERNLDYSELLKHT